MASGKLLYNRGPSLALCDDLRGGIGGAERERDGSDFYRDIDIGIIMTDFILYTRNQHIFSTN